MIILLENFSKGCTIIITQQVLEDILLENTLLSIEGFSLVLTIILLVIYWKRSEDSAFFRGYTVYTVFMFIYILSHMMKHLNEGIDLKEVYLSYIKCISFIFAQITCLVLSWLFLNYRKRLNIRILLIYILPTVYAILLITNRWHGIMGNIIIRRNDYVFYKSLFCEAFEMFIFISVSPFIFIIFRKLFQQRGYLFRQGFIIVLAGAIPLILYGYRILLNGDLLPTLVFDPVPVISSVVVLILGFAALRYRLLNLVPIAFKEFAENISIPFLILDNEYIIIYYNSAFKQAFPFRLEEQLNKSMDMLLKEFNVYAVDEEEIEILKFHIFSENITVMDCELCICLPEEKYYKVSVQPITAYGNERIGKLISFSDITDYKNLAKVEAELASTKTRFEMSRDAHDVIGHAMTHIILCLRKDLSNLSEEELKLRSNTISALKMAEEKMSEFRKLLYKDFNDNTLNISTQPADYTKKFITFLQSLKSGLPHGITLNITIGNLFEINEKNLFKVLYMICLEGINNSLKHGQSQNIDIILNQNNNCIRLNIIDDGKGCKKINKGIGLSGISERVNSLGGTVKFLNEEGDGFRILAEIPLKSEPTQTKRELKEIV